MVGQARPTDVSCSHESVRPWIRCDCACDSHCLFVSLCTNTFRTRRAGQPPAYGLPDRETAPTPPAPILHAQLAQPIEKTQNELHSIRGAHAIVL